MKWVIAIFLLPSVCFGQGFAGTWDIVTEVTYDNCWNMLGSVTQAPLKIKQKESVLSYNRSRLGWSYERALITPIKKRNHEALITS